jgi:hypothetical protein
MSVNLDAASVICDGCNVRLPWEHRCFNQNCGCLDCGTVIAPHAPMRFVAMTTRSSSGAWQEHSLPAWIGFAALVDARKRFQAEQDANKNKLGYCARTCATAWISKNLPEWEKRLGQGFDSLMVAYALCLDRRAIKLTEREWKNVNS